MENDSHPKGIRPGLWTGVLVCTVLVAVTLTVYLPAGDYPLVNFDDPVYVTENPRVRSGIYGQDGLAGGFDGAVPASGPDSGVGGFAGMFIAVQYDTAGGDGCAALSVCAVRVAVVSGDPGAGDRHRAGEISGHGPCRQPGQCRCSPASGRTVPDERPVG